MEADRSEDLDDPEEGEEEVMEEEGSEGDAEDAMAELVAMEEELAGAVDEEVLATQQEEQSVEAGDVSEDCVKEDVTESEEELKEGSLARRLLWRNWGREGVERKEWRIWEVGNDGEGRKDGKER